MKKTYKKIFKGSKHILWCCKNMEFAANDERCELDLCIATRTYFIVDSRGAQNLSYCPWCAMCIGTLMYKRRDILEKEYGITDIFDKNIPQEFLTEEWWIKRLL